MSNVGDYCYNPKQGVSEIIGSNSNNFTYRKANNMQDEVELDNMPWPCVINNF